MKCPKCLKEMRIAKPNSYECSNCNFKINIYPDEETPVEIFDKELRASWYRAGEGYWGDYNPENPEDRELLRFDIDKMTENGWEAVDDASYCTAVPADTEIDKLVKGIYIIFKEYKDVDLDSCKKLGEALSWISLE
jgi:DNA-directed RNA polymerase subunit RPC12/RpoP